MTSAATTQTQADAGPNAISAAATSRWQRGLRLCALCLGTALIVMEANVVNLALPTIRARLHAGADDGLWIVDAYILAFAVLLLPAGRLGDRIGPRRAYLLGLLILGAASIGCAVAPTAGWLIGARAGQGIGAALLAPAPLTLITRTYLEPGERARAVSIWVAASGIGMVLGPLLSGLLVGTLGWRSIFLLNLPVVVLTMWLLIRYVGDVAARSVGFDLTGQVLATLALSAVVWALVESSRLGWASPPVVTVLASGVFLLAVFFSRQRIDGAAGRDVLLPPAILTSRPVRAGLAVGAAYNFVLYGMLLVYSYNLQSLRGYSPQAAGLAFLPLTLTGIFVSTLLAGRLVAARGPRTGILTGLACFIAGLATLALAAQSTPYPLIAAGFILTAFGMAITAPAQTLAVMAAIPDDHKNMASSALNTARQTGGVLGVALLGAVVSGDLAARTPWAMLIAIGACLLAAAATWRLIPSGELATRHEAHPLISPAVRTFGLRRMVAAGIRDATGRIRASRKARVDQRRYDRALATAPTLESAHELRTIALRDPR